MYNLHLQKYQYNNPKQLPIFTILSRNQNHNPRPIYLYPLYPVLPTATKLTSILGYILVVIYIIEERRFLPYVPIYISKLVTLPIYMILLYILFNFLFWIVAIGN
jgi:hypothetical protein